MLKKMGIPRLGDTVKETLQFGSSAVLDPERAELLAQSLEEQMSPIIKEAIRDAVKDGARRLARDLRKRLDDELALMVREAVDDAIHNEMLRRRDSA